MIDILIQERLREGIVILIDQFDLILLLFLLLLALHSQLLLEVQLRPEFLGLFEPSLESSVEVLHAVDFSLPVFVHGLVLVTDFSDQGEGEFEDVEGAFLRADCKDVLALFVELHGADADGSHGVLHGPFVGLVHEVPNVDGSVGLADEANASPTGTPAASSVEASLSDHAAE